VNEWSIDDAGGGEQCRYPVGETKKLYPAPYLKIKKGIAFVQIW
jgi:hypothetical protein